MKKKNRIIIACAFAAVAVAAALPSFFIPSEQLAENIQAPTVEENYVAAAAVLRQGARGSDVKEVQRRLKQWGYYSGSVDGIFGTGTRSAVIRFQKKNGLKADGVVGKETYKALGMNDAYQALQNSVPSQSGTGCFSESDVYLLARTIYSEGR